MRWLLGLLFLVALPAIAGDAVLSWTPPTKNTDGSTLSDLAGFKIYWGQAQGTYPNSVSVPDPSATTYTVTGLTAGTWYFVATALSSTAESMYSNVASKVILAEPNPPASLSTGTVETAYLIQYVKDQSVALEVGTVPAGTPCDPNQYISTGGNRPVDAETLFLVPVASVEFLPSVTGRDVAVYAKCQ